MQKYLHVRFFLMSLRCIIILVYFDSFSVLWTCSRCVCSTEYWFADFIDQFSLWSVLFGCHICLTPSYSFTQLPVNILIRSVFDYVQRAWYSSLGSFTLSAAASGHQRQTRPVNSTHCRPHPHRKPETGARKFSFPKGGVQQGCQSLLYGSGCAHHTQQR